MRTITRKIFEYLDKQGINRHKLSQIIDYKPGSLYKMINGEDKFPDHVIEKIAPALGISVKQFKSWILADKYSKEIIELAIKAKREKTGDKLILTAKLDEVLKSKNLSRTALSKLIEYSQGGLNEMIIGKEPMSKPVISKISSVLDMSENEIKSWIAADKYSVELFETALIEL